MLDPELCYQALLARDERFDGRFFVGVTSTGIYCRPICPATTAKPAHCRFYPSAGAAQTAGFRPCLRCRPESAPDTAVWRGSSSTVTRALMLIAKGELDGEGASVDAFAERLGIGSRQLRRLFTRHLGASPVAIAQTRRVLFAKQLIHDTQLSMAQVALAAGFGSVRRFNETFQVLYGRAPSTLRRRRTLANDTAVDVRLRYRPPYDWERMLAYLRARAVPGLEHVSREEYCRALQVGDAFGTVRVTHDPARQSLHARIQLSCVRELGTVVSNVRNLFDLGADIGAINAHLCKDPSLRPWVEQRPGLRLAGAWDGFEYAVRAVLGQQVSVSAAGKLVTRVVERAGARITTEHPALTHAFPNPTAVLNTNWEDLGVPRARSNALLAVARAAAQQPDLFVPRATLEQDVERLMQIAGVGPWTAHTIALRALRTPNAFPVGDSALLDAATALGIVGAVALAQRAVRWQPFRGYAAAHLWAAKSDGASTFRSEHDHEPNTIKLEARTLPRSNRDAGGNAGAVVRRGGGVTRRRVRQRPRAHAD